MRTDRYTSVYPKVSGLSHNEIINNKYSKSNKKGCCAKLTRLTHKIAIQLHVVAESSTICSSRSRRPVRKLLDTPSCTTTLHEGVKLPMSYRVSLKSVDWCHSGSRGKADEQTQPFKTLLLSEPWTMYVSEKVLIHVFPCLMLPQNIGSPNIIATLTCSHGLDLTLVCQIWCQDGLIVALLLIHTELRVSFNSRNVW
jgi:hypothetical protein